MKCPDCVKENKESCVYPGMSYITDTYYLPFYDEKGNYHNHDRNVITTKYTCSNGHDFTEKTHNICWCEMGK